MSTSERIRHIKRGDTGPAIEVDLTDNGVSVGDLTGASVRALGSRRGTSVLDQVITGDANGRVTIPEPRRVALTE